MTQAEKPKTEKIQKYIARCGYCSRRKAEEMIAAGLVKVNNKLAVIGQRIDPEKDIVEVNGEIIKPVDEKIYIMFNKPTGVITTISDERGRKSVMDFVSRFIENEKYRVFPVGRLDRNSTGLLLLTNDGELAARILDPKNHIPKEYIVTVKGHPSRKKLNELQEGIVIDGKKTLPCRIEMRSRDNNTTTLKITLYEGKKRQIRKMMKHIKHPVISLNRVAIGPLRLKNLKRGQFRYLTDDEVKKLKEAVFGKGEV